MQGEEEMKKCEKCEEYLAGWQRARADYENLTRQTTERRDEDRRRVRADLAEALLPVVDNFGYVTKNVPDAAECGDDFKKKFATWFEGIGHIDRQFAEALAALGVQPIPSVGEAFDPTLHEAAGTKTVPDTEPGQIIEELVRGWRIGDIILRPARVIVNDVDSKQ